MREGASDLPDVCSARTGVRTILVYDPNTRVIVRYLSIIVDANLTFSFVSRLFLQLKLLDLMSRRKLLDLMSIFTKHSLAVY